MTDNELMIRVREGDVQQLGVLFERHHARLFRFLFRLTGNQEASKDAVQDVFHRMLKYRHTFRGDGKFTTWMYHLARNVVRRSYATCRAAPPLDAARLATREEGLPDRQLEHKQAAIRLRAALNRLPLRHREVLVLSRYEDLKYKDIAAILGCSEAAVKTRVHRALKDLRDGYFELSREANP